MNDSTEHPLHETALHDALRAQVRGSGGDVAGAYLVGLADGALRIARRRQRLSRAGIGVVAAVAVATAGMAVADAVTPRAHVGQPAAGVDTTNSGKAALISFLPVTASNEHACAQGSDGYPVPASASHPEFCVQADRARGMTDVQVASAKADKSGADGTWRVEVTLDSADRTRFAALTGSVASAPVPRNEIAIVVDGKLWGTPSVTSSITGGRIEIVGTYAGDLTGAAAHDLAHRLDPN
ncbi:SecDF P1 head subdomain-containing protein [Streptomyces sp. NPDC020489]|uniref:SecDF P1 head subdomain-containing protein n=1 Tax=Streptomyces sp. NPDC020489 TaxID=3365077 RepID=UPI0037A668FA